MSHPLVVKVVGNTPFKIPHGTLLKARYVGHEPGPFKFDAILRFKWSEDVKIMMNLRSHEAIIMERFRDIFKCEECGLIQTVEKAGIISDPNTMNSELRCGRCNHTVEFIKRE